MSPPTVEQTPQISVAMRRRRRLSSALHRRLTCCVAAAVVTLATACGSGSPAGGHSAASGCRPSKGTVNLTFWSYAPQAPDIVKAFNATHPRIHVTLKQISGNVVQQVTNAIKAGTAPDVGMVELSDIPSYRAANGVKDIAACPGVGQLKDKLLPWTWRQATMGTGSVYAVPWDISPIAMYYRTDVLAKYHVAVPTTWAEYYAAAKKLRAGGKGPYILDFPAGYSQLLISLMWQAGARPFKYVGDGVSVDLLVVRRARCLPTGSA